MLRASLEVVAVRGERMRRRTRFGGHHVEKAINQSSIVGCHVRERASAAIIRAVKSWPVRPSAVMA